MHHNYRRYPHSVPVSYVTTTIISIHPSQHLSINSPNLTYIYIYIIHLSIHLSSIHTCIHPSILSSIHPSIHPTIYPSILSSIHPSINSSIYSSIYLSIYPSITGDIFYMGFDEITGCVLFISDCRRYHIICTAKMTLFMIQES